MSHFTPGASLAGGVLIGLAAALLWLGNGRIAGISGILGGVWSAQRGDVLWRLAFLLGLVVAPLGYAALRGMPAIDVKGSFMTLTIAGLLVGFGTRLGGGCTSGHGVCGLGRFSKRSIAATGLFMAAAAVTVFVTRHLLGGA